MSVLQLCHRRTTLSDVEFLRYFEFVSSMTKRRRELSASYEKYCVDPGRASLHSNAMSHFYQSNIRLVVAGENNKWGEVGEHVGTGFYAVDRPTVRPRIVRIVRIARSYLFQLPRCVAIPGTPDISSFSDRNLARTGSDQAICFMVDNA